MDFPPLPSQANHFFKAEEKMMRFQATSPGSACTGGHIVTRRALLADGPLSLRGHYRRHPIFF
jgi:hypothetical protein